MITVLSIILFILLLSIANLRGLKAYLCFYINLFIILMYIIFMGIGFNAIILAIITCILSSIVSLFLLNGINIKTKSSFISILIVLSITFLIIFIISKVSNIGGFSYEDYDSIQSYSFDINYSMNNVLIGMFLVCSIGTIIDTSISISSALNEIYLNNLRLSKKSLFKSGMSVGSDILATTINTLYFAFFGGFIGFLFFHYSSSVGFIINYKTFAVEVIELLFTFISSILIIPITSYITTHYLILYGKNKKNIV